MTNLFQLTWFVPSGGFEWADRKYLSGAEVIGPARFLLPVASADSQRTYDVFQDPAAYRNFAAISLESFEAETIRFAKRYGALGGVYHFDSIIVGPGKGYGSGEMLSDWQSEVTMMRHTIDLWENIQQKRRAKLEPFLEWRRSSNGAQATYTIPRPRRKGRRGFFTPDWEYRLDEPGRFPLQEGDVLGAAWLALIRIINGQLAKHRLEGSLLGHSTRDAERSADFILQPSSLIAALWVQFAHAVAGNPKYNRCEHCHWEFEITTQKRADARFCSVVCRVRAHRERQKQSSKPRQSRKRRR